MPLWGATPNTNEGKPNWLTANQRANCFATSQGWVLRENGIDEVLVSIGQLSNTLGNANVSGLTFGSHSYANTAPVIVTVEFNELVNVAVNANLVAVASNTSNSQVNVSFKCNAAAGTFVSRIQFTGNAYGVATRSNITIGSQTILGTITGTDGNGAGLVLTTGMVALTGNALVTPT